MNTLEYLLAIHPQRMQDLPGRLIPQKEIKKINFYNKRKIAEINRTVIKININYGAK